MNETSHKICARRFRSEVDDVVVDQVVRGWGGKEAEVLYGFTVRMRE